jgi:crotonobetainyl-CoA hydratase
MTFQNSIDMLNAQELETVRKLYNSEDMREGALAFAEKRNPVWKGK